MDKKLPKWNKTNELDMMMIMTHDGTFLMKLVMFSRFGLR